MEESANTKERRKQKPREVVQDAEEQDDVPIATREAVVDSDESEEEDIVVIQQEVEMSDGVDSEDVAGVDGPADESDAETSNLQAQQSIDFEAVPVEDVEDEQSMDSTVAYVESEVSAGEQVQDDNEADSESSETESSSPVLRKSTRGRVPKTIFTYNNLGHPTTTML